MGKTGCYLRAQYILVFPGRYLWAARRPCEIGTSMKTFPLIGPLGRHPIYLSRRNCRSSVGTASSRPLKGQHRPTTMLLLVENSTLGPNVRPGEVEQRPGKPPTPATLPTGLTPRSSFQVSGATSRDFWTFVGWHHHR